MAEYDKQINEKLGKETMVDILMQKLAARGDKGVKRADVKKALGLTSPLESAVFGGQTPEEVGKSIGTGITTALTSIPPVAIGSMAPTATSVTKELQTGITTSIQGFTIISTIVTAWKLDIEQNGARLGEVGWAVGTRLWDGVLLALAGSNFVGKIADAVLAQIEAEL